MTTNEELLERYRSVLPSFGVLGVTGTAPHFVALESPLGCAVRKGPGRRCAPSADRGLPHPSLQPAPSVAGAGNGEYSPFPAGGEVCSICWSSHGVVARDQLDTSARLLPEGEPALEDDRAYEWQLSSGTMKP